MANILRKIIENDKGEIKKLEKTAKKVESYADAMAALSDEELQAKTEEFLQPVVDEHGFELVEVEYVKEGSDYYLRAYIDKEGGITVNDCEAVAREMNEILDREDFVEDSYVFEVSSPGLGRPLKKEKDYVRSMGKEIEIRTYRAINREKEF